MRSYEGWASAKHLYIYSYNPCPCAGKWALNPHGTGEQVEAWNHDELAHGTQQLVGIS